jgi:peptidoglycan-associated lipoprotein
MISFKLTRHSALAVFCVVALTALGCANRDTLPDTSASSVGADSGASSSRSDDNGGIQVSAIEAERERQRQQLMQQLVVYFDYDQTEIRPEFNQMLSAHGQYLAQNPRVQVRLEGHADERGSREYNIGLGERRAQAVRRVLMLQGTSGEQLSTVSYGEERPAAVGSDEEAMSLNRRVELVYRQ